MNENKGILWYYCRSFVRPRETFTLLLGNDRYFLYGFAYILIPITGYTLMYIFLTIGNGAPSVFTPWLNIPKDVYYSINRFLLAPSLVMSWLMAAGVVQIVARLFRGKGSYEETVAILALCIGIAMWGTLIHDLPMSLLSAIGVIDARQHEIAMNSPTIWRTLLWISFGIYITAFVTLFSVCVKVVHRLSYPASAGIGLAGFVVFQIIFLIFNR